MPPRSVVPAFALLVLSSGVSACRHDSIRSESRSDPLIAAAAQPTAMASVAMPSPPPRVLPPPVIERAPVVKDSPASFVRGETEGTARVVFLPGLCSNAAAYLTAFPHAAQTHGGVLAIDGDKPCGAANSGFHSFTWDPTLQHARIERALAAAGMTAPTDGFTLVGYSAGASIAELVHEKWPALFPRLVLIAPPEDLWLEKLVDAQGVVSMSCSRDVPARMKAGAKRLGARGVRAIYMEMPKCTHGNIADGERIFDEAFTWLDRGVGGEPGE